MHLDPAEIKKILFIKLRHIGDVLLTAPVARALKNAFPHASVTALVYSGTEEMLTLNPAVDEVLVFDLGWKKLPRCRRLWAETAFTLGLRKKGFDLVINLTEGDRGAVMAFVSGAGIKVGLDPKGQGILGKHLVYDLLYYPQDQRAHMVDQNLDAVRALGVADPDRKVDILFDEKDRDYVNQRLDQLGCRRDRPLIHIHPASRWLFKAWPARYVAELIDHLILNRGAEVILTCGPADRELAYMKDIKQALHCIPIDLSGQTTLKQLAVVSSLSHLFFGVDTVAMHLAAAVGTPVVALFGPSGEFNWGPWGTGHRVIKKDWDCRPCGRDGCQGSKKSRCLEELTVAEVIPVLDEYL
ncbi:MAG: putative lipopolysaccharide heptosyltransferase III [Deltaproteobacteria bacterium]|nr:putative lipopolysaccharide heptosyltransferase III [Deltaproteobacteria bacterium]